jgi:hypothetical protein
VTGRQIDRPAPGGIPAPPYAWSSEDYASRVISIVIDYNQTTGNITGATTHRDPGCLFSRILIGVGGDGSPENAPHKIQCQEGDHSHSAGQLHAVGLDTYADVISNQITAGL